MEARQAGAFHPAPRFLDQPLQRQWRRVRVTDREYGYLYPGGILIFTVFAAMAQFERDLIRERTQAGLTAARARGRKGGRPAKLAPDQIRAIQSLYTSQTPTVTQMARQYHVSRKTIYNVLRQYRITVVRQ